MEVIGVILVLSLLGWWVMSRPVRGGDHVPARFGIDTDPKAQAFIQEVRGAYRAQDMLDALVDEMSPEDIDALPNVSAHVKAQLCAYREERRQSR